MRDVIWDCWNPLKQNAKVDHLGSVVGGLIGLGIFLVGMDFYKWVVAVSMMVPMFLGLLYYNWFGIGVSDTMLLCPLTREEVIAHAKRLASFCILFPAGLTMLGMVVVGFVGGIEIPKLILPVLNMAVISYFGCGSSFYIRNKTNQPYSITIADAKSGMGTMVCFAISFTYMLILIAAGNDPYFEGLYVIEWVVFLVIVVPIALLFAKDFRANFEASLNYEGMLER